MSEKKRIERIAAEEWTGAKVFDEEAYGIRFRIEQSGRCLTRAFPDLESEELATKSDDELRRLLHILTGRDPEAPLD